MLGSSSFLFSLSIGSTYPHGFCWFLYAISFLFFFPGFVLWPWPDLQTVMNFLFFESGIFLHLSALAHFLFWSPSLIHDVGFLPAYSVTLPSKALFLLFAYYNFPSQSFLSGIFLFFLPCYPVAVKPPGTNHRSPTDFLLFMFLVATFNNNFTFSSHAALHFQWFPVTSLRFLVCQIHWVFYPAAVHVLLSTTFSQLWFFTFSFHFPDFATFRLLSSYNLSSFFCVFHIKAESGSFEASHKWPFVFLLSLFPCKHEKSALTLLGLGTVGNKKWESLRWSPS